MRADIHDGPEHMLQSEAGYIDARPLTPARQKLLQRTAGPYIGSKASICPPAMHFRSSPMNRHRQRPSACLKRAKSGLLHRSNCFLFDHLIGELLELPRDFEAKGLR